MIDQLGTLPLFIGVESQYWTLAQFQQAAQRAKVQGITALLVKIADGGVLWYQSIGGWRAVLDTVKQAGIKAIPYTYCYGDKFNAIAAEISILASAMQYCGIAVADLESEYNNHVAWAQHVTASLNPVFGTLGIVTWANPLQQEWADVMAALAPCVSFWMPQVYSNNLAAIYQAQYAGYNNVYPVLNLGTDFGPNDPLQIAQASNSPIVGLWEYQAISAYASTIQSIVHLLQQETTTMLQISQVNKYFTEIEKDRRWRCIKTGQDIAYGMLAFYRSFGQVGLNGLSIFGLPISAENPVPHTKVATIELFERGAILYDPNGEVDKVPGLPGPCYPAHIDSGLARQLLITLTK